MDDVPPDLQLRYLDWAREALGQLHTLCGSLAQYCPSGSNELQQIFELAHSLKGVGGSFGDPLTTRIMGWLCQHIVTMRQKAADGRLQTNGVTAAIDELTLALGADWPICDADYAAAVDQRLAAFG